MDFFSIYIYYQILELISSALRDQSEAEFMGRRDLQNNPLPSPFEPIDRQLGLSCRRRLNPFQPSDVPDSIPLTPAVLDWTVRNVLSAGSLLGKSCQSALILAGHGEHIQKQGFLFGKHLSLAWQVKHWWMISENLQTRDKKKKVKSSWIFNNIVFVLKTGLENVITMSITY